MKYLVTSALPYANAPLHLGYILEAVQTDVWVRHLKLNGHEAHYFCALDTHGTPVMLKAKDEGVTPEQLISDIYELHKSTLANFNIDLENFHSTHSSENEELTSSIFNKAVEKNIIFKETIQQLYDEQEGIFLADRFVKGECPACGALDQYGDACEKCGSTYDALELKNPKSVLSNTAPIAKDSEHYFFKLDTFSEFLKSSVEHLSDQQPIKHKLNEWLDGELKNWDISRDEPYFGFKIPGESSKYFYVWMDAPVGYLASIKNWADKNNVNFEDLLNNPDTNLVHFIGKDIVYFHLLFWPAMLNSADIHQLKNVFVHGFLTIEGMKMSKSKGNFILADHALKFSHPDYYRYYLSSKLNTDIADIDFSIDDFIQKVNSDLIGKFINIASRSQNFISKLNSGNVMASTLGQEKKLREEYDLIISHTQNREYSKALKGIMALADQINTYISEQEPWKMAKEDRVQECVEVCSNALHVFKDLTILLHPYIPEITNKLFEMLNLSEQTYDNLLEGNLVQVEKFKPFVGRLDKANFEGMLE